MGPFVSGHISGSDAPWREQALVTHANMLLRSFRRIVGRDLLATGEDETDNARRLFEDEPERSVRSRDRTADSIKGAGR